MYLSLFLSLPGRDYFDNVCWLASKARFYSGGVEKGKPVLHCAQGTAAANKKTLGGDHIGLHGLSGGQVPEHHGLRFQVPALPASPPRVAAPKFQQTCKFKPPQQRALGNTGACLPEPKTMVSGRHTPLFP
jgi:hypothetical protein